MKYIYSVLVLLLALFLAAFIQQNGESVTLKYFGWSTPALPLSLYIIVAFAAGYVLAVIVGLTSGIRFRVRTAGAEREVRKLRKELAETRDEKQGEDDQSAKTGSPAPQSDSRVKTTRELSPPQPEITPEPSLLKGVTADELRDALEDEEETDSWDDNVEER